MRFVLLLLIFFLRMSEAPAQSKNHKNSLKDYEQLNRDVEKNRKNFNASRKAFDSTQKIHLDSLKEVMMQKDIEQNNKTLDAFVAEKKEQEQDEEKSLWVRAGLLVVVLAGMIIVKIRSRKKI